MMKCLQSIVLILGFKKIGIQKKNELLSQLFICF